MNHKTSLEINEGLLRIHAKLTALSEIVWASSENGGLALGADAAYGLYCVIDERADEAQRLKDMNERGYTE
jgi:hypothetical protein